MGAINHNIGDPCRCVLSLSTPTAREEGPRALGGGGYSGFLSQHEKTYSRYIMIYTKLDAHISPNSCRLGPVKTRMFWWNLTVQNPNHGSLVLNLNIFGKIGAVAHHEDATLQQTDVWLKLLTLQYISTNYCKY